MKTRRDLTSPSPSRSSAHMLRRQDSRLQKRTELQQRFSESVSLSLTCIQLQCCSDKWCQLLAVFLAAEHKSDS